MRIRYFIMNNTTCSRVQIDGDTPYFGSQKEAEDFIDENRSVLSGFSLSICSEAEPAESHLDKVRKVAPIAEDIIRYLKWRNENHISDYSEITAKRAVAIYLDIDLATYYKELQEELGTSQSLWPLPEKLFASKEEVKNEILLDHG